MTQREDVAPSTLSVELREEGVVVEYLDGRTVLYHGVPAAVEDDLRCAPGKDVHVLVTDESESEGVMVYVNDRNTDAEILESTGVGRVMLDPGESASLFPGVTARADGYATVVEADTDAARGRVFVFEEDEMGEAAYELV